MRTNFYGWRLKNFQFNFNDLLFFFSFSDCWLRCPSIDCGFQLQSELNLPRRCCLECRRLSSILSFSFLLLLNEDQLKHNFPLNLLFPLNSISFFSVFLLHPAKTSEKFHKILRIAKIAGSQPEQWEMLKRDTISKANMPRKFDYLQEHPILSRGRRRSRVRRDIYIFLRAYQLICNCFIVFFASSLSPMPIFEVSDRRPRNNWLLCKVSLTPLLKQRTYTMHLYVEYIEVIMYTKEEISFFSSPLVVWSFADTLFSRVGKVSTLCRRCACLINSRLARLLLLLLLYCWLPMWVLTCLF